MPNGLLCPCLYGIVLQGYSAQEATCLTKTGLPHPLLLKPSVIKQPPLLTQERTGGYSQAWICLGLFSDGLFPLAAPTDLWDSFLPHTSISWCLPLEQNIPRTHLTITGTSVRVVNNFPGITMCYNKRHSCSFNTWNHVHGYLRLQDTENWITMA